jgi:3-hydroxy-3-methylglutaryl CoA synthase
MLSAFDAIKAGTSGRALLAAADMRPAEPRTASEAIFGDGAAALLLGADDLIAILEGQVSINDEFLGTWRRDTDPYVQQFPGGFESKFGYQRVLGESVSKLLKRLDVKPVDVARLILYTPNARAAQAVAKKLEMDPKTQLADPLLGAVGDTGCAQVLIGLAHVLETAKPGDRIVVASYGDGSDALLFRVTEAIESRRDRRGVTYYLSRKRPMPSYGRYALFRDLAKTIPSEGTSSPVVLWREIKQDLQLYGEKCRKCGMIQFRASASASTAAPGRLRRPKLAGAGRCTFTTTICSLAGSAHHRTVVRWTGRPRAGADDGRRSAGRPHRARGGPRARNSTRGGLKNYFWKARPRD